jgi:hypothetical protein
VDWWLTLKKLTTNPQLFKADRFSFKFRKLAAYIYLMNARCVVTFLFFIFACQAICPHSKNPITHVHSYYTRHPADMPISARHIYLYLQVRNLHCLNPDFCCKQTFSEPCALWLLPYARRTTQLTHAQQEVAMAAGGRAGARRSAMPMDC